MIRLIFTCVLSVCVFTSNVGCTTSFLSPADGMGVQQPKIHFKKTRTSLEASASSNFKGDLKFDGQYNKADGDFKGSLEAHVDSDASTVTESQVEKIKALESSYAKYSDNMTAIAIAQAKAWSDAFSSLTQAIPGLVGAIPSKPTNPTFDPIGTILSVWNSLPPEAKADLISKLTGDNQPPIPPR